MDNVIPVILFTVILGSVFFLIKSAQNKKKLLKEKLGKTFPELWKEILKKKVIFYNELNEADAGLFEKRIRVFLATKNIEGIETEIDDAVKLMVASSAVIPTFAFPDYNYPYVKTILIYPNSFDEKYQTERFEGHKEFITGMVGSSFQNGTVILSKPDLIKAFDGHPHKENVGIHEFVHLLDKEDGDIDGIPEAMIDRKFVGPWLHEIKNEIKRIEDGKSDINPYALTNNAEFLAVVSEYFFSNPEKFQKRHPELYRAMSSVFNRHNSEEAFL